MTALPLVQPWQRLRLPTFGELRGGLRLTGFLLSLLIFLPGLILLHALGSEGKRVAYIRGCYRMLCKLIGLRVIVTGRPTAQHPALYVANHLSLFDIPVMGSVVKGAFISRGDIGHWPVFGYLARLQRTVFVSRTRSGATAEAKAISTRLAEGGRLVLFPEGSTGDGVHLLPFKTTFFGVAEPVRMKDGGERQVTVQPISICMTKVGDLPASRAQRALYAWFGDMEFPPHLWQGLSLAGFTVEVRFHDTTTMAEAGGRKELARWCEQRISEGFQRSLTGQDA